MNDELTASPAASHPARRSRLMEARKDDSLTPWVRAVDVTDCSLYWMPISGFPMPHLERQWMLAFLTKLGAKLKKTGLREEWFLLFNYLFPDLLDTFTSRAGDYMPIAGMTLTPGHAPVKRMEFEELKEVIENAEKKGEMVDVTQWMPDGAQWFARKHPEEQRRDFFGHGGTFGLYLKPPAEVPQLPEIPLFIRSHPSFSADIEADYQMAMSMQDGFLQKSKEMFGEPFRNDPAYEGFVFILPLLNAEAAVSAEPKERQRWLELADAYFFESKEDNGMLLLCKDPEFDESLREILDELREEGKTVGL
jgi:hypothetical protein